MSLAGGTAAVTLREADFDGRVILIGAEAHLPYERPPLSKQYLRGEMPVDKMLLRPEEFYTANSIEIKLGIGAQRVEPGAKVVELANGGDCFGVICSHFNAQCSLPNCR